MSPRETPSRWGALQARAPERPLRLAWRGRWIWVGGIDDARRRLIQLTLVPCMRCRRSPTGSARSKGSSSPHWRAPSGEAWSRASRRSPAQSAKATGTVEAALPIRHIPRDRSKRLACTPQDGTKEMHVAGQHARESAWRRPDKRCAHPPAGTSAGHTPTCIPPGIAQTRSLLPSSKGCRGRRSSSLTSAWHPSAARRRLESCLLNAPLPLGLLIGMPGSASRPGP